MLNAALVILLSLLVSPHSVSSIAANDVFLTDSTPSLIGLQNYDLGNPEGDKPDIHRAPDWLGVVTPQYIFARITHLVSTADIAFTVSQARAPPGL